MVAAFGLLSSHFLYFLNLLLFFPDNMLNPFW